MGYCGPLRSGAGAALTVKGGESGGMPPGSRVSEMPFPALLKDIYNFVPRAFA